MSRKYRMGVKVTLVFSDEMHREAWLDNHEFFETSELLQDYKKRRASQDLTFVVGPVQGRRSKHEGR